MKNTKADTTTLPKCQYVGCGHIAIRQLKCKVGKHQTLNVCGPHSPKWSYDGTGSKFYTVKKL